MIFIDTGPFLARYATQDRLHETATRGWSELASVAQRCLTTNFVLDEVLTLLARRVSYDFAAERAEILWSSEALTIARPDEDDELAAVGLLRKFADQRVNFTDCVSFAVMRRHRIRRAFTFDRHFDAAGFEVWPRPPR